MHARKCRSLALDQRLSFCEHPLASAYFLWAHHLGFCVFIAQHQGSGFGMAAHHWFRTIRWIKAMANSPSNFGSKLALHLASLHGFGPGVQGRPHGLLVGPLG